MQIQLGDLSILMQALSVAADLRKIAVTIVGLVGAAAVAVLLFSLGSTGGFSGIALGGLLALVALWAGFSLTLGTVTRMCVAQLAAGANIPWRVALGYATRHIDGFLFGPLVFAILLLLLAAAESIILLIGRIPFLGELIVALAFLPLLLVNVLALVALVFGGWLLFPVVAAEGATAISAPIRVLQVVRRDPVKVVVQICASFFLSSVAMVIVGTLLVMAFFFTLELTQNGLGPEKWNQIVAEFLGPLAFTLGPTFNAARAAPTIGIAKFLFTIAFVGFIGISWALPTVFLISSSCAVYLGAAGQPQDEAAPEPVLEPNIAV